MQLLDAAILDNEGDFAALEEDWEDLYQNSPRYPVPILGLALLLVGVLRGELRTAADHGARRCGSSGGLVPLMLERRGGFGRLLFIGTGITDHLDMLVREGWEVGVAEAGIQALRRMGASWHVADLQEVCSTAAAWKVFRNWTGPRTCVWQSNCVLVDIKLWDELLMTLKQRLRRAARRYLRRAEEDGVRCELAAPTDAEAAVRRFVALHREQWGERDIVSEHLTRRFESHLAAATRRMTARGSGGMFEFWRGTEAIASSFLVWREGDCVGVYLTGANEDAHERYQISSLYMHNAVNVALSRSSTYVSLLRGEEPWKLWWNPRIVPNYRLTLGNSSVTFGPYAGYLALRFAAVRYATRYTKSENASPWVKDAVTRLGRLLPL